MNITSYSNRINASQETQSILSGKITMCLNSLGSWSTGHLSIMKCCEKCIFYHVMGDGEHNRRPAAPGPEGALGLQPFELVGGTSKVQGCIYGSRIKGAWLSLERNHQGIFHGVCIPLIGTAWQSGHRDSGRLDGCWSFVSSCAMYVSLFLHSEQLVTQCHLAFFG